MGILDECCRHDDRYPHLAGTKAAASVLALQSELLAALSSAPQTAEQIAAVAGAPKAAETAYWILEHLAAKGRARLGGDDGPGQVTFSS